MLFTMQRTESTFDEIPVIDLSNASSPDPAQRLALAEKIRDACVNVTNHGIPERYVIDALEAVKPFFALPTPSKMEFDIHKSTNFKGYTKILGEKTDPNGKGPGDLHEGFDIGWEQLDQQSFSSRDDGEMSGSNVWPDLPGFKEAVLTYYHAVVQLGLKLFPLFALALDLPENFFEDKTTKPAAIMRLLHYPPQPPVIVDDDGSGIGIGAHTDYECFTILWQDNVSALQVQTTEGKWIDAVPIPGTFVLNIGDQLARWTNDVFKSTVHRAINKSGLERYSIPLFYGVDYDVPLTPIASCISSDMPAKYEVITAGEYVRHRLQETYAHSGTNP
ncbi:hypothetical protein D9757_010112 [Collybiopsis confluens]|uniref:Fe2OG dioxygenase domain-containing protein n=1 Tax=Collybiopsis confluens TaxID=2823264 RepID=A0A8H5LRZ1_9AGAR|nr:hypothetical protein D9757_010112 [Collybiopsis confluens]